MLLNYNIISKDCRLFNKIKQIYEASFPIDERRNELNFEHIASHEAKFNILGIDRGNDLIGFINYWKFDTFVYIEHFAIDANKRGDGVELQFTNAFKSCITWGLYMVLSR